MKKVLLVITSTVALASCGSYDDEIDHAVQLYKSGDYDQSCSLLFKYSEKGSARAKAVLGDNIASNNACGVVLKNDLPESDLFDDRVLDEEEFRPGGRYLSIHGLGTELVAQSSEEEYNKATFNLATLYMAQVPMPALKYNKEKAIEFYKKSALQGNPYGAFETAVRSDEIEEQIKWYTIGAENGHFKCMQTLVYMYLEGQGVEKDVDEAKRWLKEMIDQDDNVSAKRWARNQLDAIYNPATCLNC